MADRDLDGARQGLTPVVSVVIMVLLLVIISASVYTFISTMMGEEQQRIDRMIQTDVEVRGWSSSAEYLFLENTGSSPVEPEFYTGTGHILSTFNHTELEPNEHHRYYLDCIPEGTEEIIIDLEEQEYEHPVGHTPLRYCVELENTYIDVRDMETYRVFEGRVTLNNESRTPYANSELEYTFDGETETLATDEDGRFTFDRRWGVDRIPPHSMWSKTVTFESDTPVIDFHHGEGRFQPPNTARLEYEDGPEVHQTQQVMEEVESDYHDIVYDVVPEQITEDDVTFTVNMEVTPTAEMLDHWEDHADDADLLYQTWMDADAGISELSCSASDDISCRDEAVTFELDTNIDDQRFDEGDLPEDDNGNEYVPARSDITVTGQDAIAGLNPYHYFHAPENNEISRMQNRKRMTYIPEGETRTEWSNISISSIENNVQGQLDDSDASIDRTYLFRHSIVSSARGWGATPRTDRMHAYWGLNEDPDPQFTSDSPVEESATAVMYEWTDLAETTYDLNFTVTVDRGSSDTWFQLPVYMGTFGMFPEDGGQALNLGNRYGTYVNGGIRYPYFQQAGSFSMLMRVPGTTGGSDALVYKITHPTEDEWEATTYVLNGGDEPINSVYLLNAQGEWHTFEETDDGDGWVDPGELHADTFPVDAADDELIQLNMQLQTINSGATNPEYDDWEYRFELTPENETWSDTYDMSDTVDCDLTHCLSYRTGNSDEARAIDNLRDRTGQSAPRSMFEGLDEVSFELEQPDEDAAPQHLKNFKFWTWYLEPFDEDMANELDINPDELVIETREHEPHSAGRLSKEFD